MKGTCEGCNQEPVLVLAWDGIEPRCARCVMRGILTLLSEGDMKGAQTVEALRDERIEILSKAVDEVLKLRMGLAHNLRPSAATIRQAKLALYGAFNVCLELEGKAPLIPEDAKN